MTTSAEHLNLINRIDETTGASVGMWKGVDCAPIGWGQYFKFAAPSEGDRRCAPVAVHSGQSSVRERDAGEVAGLAMALL